MGVTVVQRVIDPGSISPLASKVGESGFWRQLLANTRFSNYSHFPAIFHFWIISISCRESASNRFSQSNTEYLC